MSSFTWDRIINLTLGIISCCLGSYALYLAAFRGRKLAKKDYIRVMNNYNPNPIFVLRFFIWFKGKGKVRNLPIASFYLLVYEDKFTLVTRKEPMVQFSMPVSYVTSYIQTNEILTLYFTDQSSEPPCDSYIELDFQTGNKSTVAFNKYAKSQVDYLKYFAERFPKLPTKILSI